MSARFAAPAIVCCLALAVASAQQPQFSSDNELLLPEGYRQWVLVGSSLGMSYNEGSSDAEAASQQQFHNVYLDPKAYAQFRRERTFPEGTVLMMEVYSAGSQASINRQGSFADRFLRVEAAVKDSARFPEGWAYFDFGGPAGKVRPSAKAFDKQRCWSCHNEHADDDNVFTQFYGPLRAAAPAP